MLLRGVLPLQTAQDLCIPTWSRLRPASPPATMASAFTALIVQAQSEPSGKLEGLGLLTVPTGPHAKAFLHVRPPS